MPRILSLSVLALVALLPACGKRDGPVARRLRPLKELYVPVQTASLLSMDKALAEKGIGNVMASDFRPQFQFWEQKRPEGDILAIGVYTHRDSMPEGAFLTMTPVQFLETALADPEVPGVLFNPRTPKAWFIIRREMTVALASLKEPLK